MRAASDNGQAVLHAIALFFKVRDLEAAKALISVSADNGADCLAQLLPLPFCKAFHLPERCLSPGLVLLC